MLITLSLKLLLVVTKVGYEIQQRMIASDCSCAGMGRRPFSLRKKVSKVSEVIILMLDAARYKNLAG
jgi:hypothetical protein